MAEFGMQASENRDREEGSFSVLMAEFCFIIIIIYFSEDVNIEFD